MTPSTERGSASVWVVALSAVLGVVGLATLLAGSAVVARHRAAAAADLAALAAAGSAVVGDADPCAEAARIAVDNGADLRSCSVDRAAVAQVETAVAVRLGPVGSREATARARAGPVVGPAGASAPGRRGEVLVPGHPPAVVPAGEHDRLLLVEHRLARVRGYGAGRT